MRIVKDWNFKFLEIVVEGGIELNRLIRGWKKNRVRQIGKNQIIVDINNFTRGTEKW